MHTHCTAHNHSTVHTCHQCCKRYVAGSGLLLSSQRAARPAAIPGRRERQTERRSVKNILRIVGDVWWMSPSSCSEDSNYRLKHMTHRTSHDTATKEQHTSLSVRSTDVPVVLVLGADEREEQREAEHYDLRNEHGRHRVA